MKAIQSFGVMESFGMQGLSPEELMEIDGGSSDCPDRCIKIKCDFSILPCDCKMAAKVVIPPSPCGCKGGVII